jgi:hypothetical protein
MPVKKQWQPSFGMDFKYNAHPLAIESGADLPRLLF